MNKINPKKLLLSKWTAVSPQNKEKHHIVTEVEFDEDGSVDHCLLEAVISKRTWTINWKELKNETEWLPGWK